MVAAAPVHRFRPEAAAAEATAVAVVAAVAVAAAAATMETATTATTAAATAPGLNFLGDDGKAQHQKGQQTCHQQAKV
jgi:hypothetical protein